MQEGSGFSRKLELREQKCFVTEKRFPMGACCTEKGIFETTI
jgi:hypothetical protein